MTGFWGVLYQRLVLQMTFEIWRLRTVICLHFIFRKREIIWETQILCFVRSLHFKLINSLNNGILWRLLLSISDEIIDLYWAPNLTESLKLRDVIFPKSFEWLIVLSATIIIFWGALSYWWAWSFLSIPISSWDRISSCGIWNPSRVNLHNATHFGHNMQFRKYPYLQ